MSIYIKTMMVIIVFIVAVAIVGFKVSVDTTVNVLQKGLDSKVKDDAALIALSLNGVDIETEVDLVESLIKGAYALGSFEEVTLYGKPTGDSQNLKMQNKKDLGENALKNSFFELKASESLADIMLDGQVQGKVLVKNDITVAFTQMQETIASLMKLFLILGLGAIVIIGVIVKLIVKTPNQ